MVFGNVVYVNSTGLMTNVFYYSILQTSPGLSYVRNVAMFF